MISSSSSSSASHSPTPVQTVQTGKVHWTYVRCQGEPAVGRALANPIDNNAVGTVESCLALAAAAGYVHAGLEYGGECWASNGNPYGGAIPESYCDMPCKGNHSEICGGGNTISYYTSQVSNASPVISHTSGSQPWNYRSCWGEPQQGRALPNKIISSGATAQTCLDAATAMGFAHAGLEYGGECWAAIAEPYGGEIPESYCDMPCSLDTSQSCGGGFTLTLYSAATIAKPMTTVASTGTWYYAGCWGEPAVGRALGVPIDNNAGGTIETCLAIAQSLGYTYCGLEYGGQCFCSPDNKSIYGGAIPQSYCDMPCKGNSAEFCGGGNTLSLYGFAA